MSVLKSPFLAIACAVVGFGILLFEGVRVYDGTDLSGINVILLWGALGLVVVGAVLLVLSAALSTADVATQTDDETAPSSG